MLPSDPGVPAHHLSLSFSILTLFSIFIRKSLSQLEFSPSFLQLESNEINIILRIENLVRSLL